MLTWMLTNAIVPPATREVLLILLGLLAILLVALLLVRLRRQAKAKTGEPPPVSPLPSLQAELLPPAVSGPYLAVPAQSAEFSVFSLTAGDIRIGRAPDNDLVVTEDAAGWETVSQYHARLYKQGEEWRVQDLNSRNGLYVNGRRTGHNVVQDGWKLGIGKMVVVFHRDPGDTQ
jgi:hypothetical protein